MTARLLAAAAVVVGCGFAGVGPAAATTDAEILPSPEPSPVEELVPPSPVELLPTVPPSPTPPPSADGSPDVPSAESSTDPAPSAPPSPVPETVQPEPRPSDEQPDPSPTASSPPTAEEVTDGPGSGTEATTEDPAATELDSETTIVDEPEASLVPEPTATTTDTSDPLAEPVPSVEAAPAAELAPEPTPPATSTPAPSGTRAPADLGPPEDTQPTTVRANATTSQAVNIAGSAVPVTASAATPTTSETCATQSATESVASTGSGPSVITPVIPPLTPRTPPIAWVPHGSDDDLSPRSAGPLSAIEHTALTGAGLALMGQRVSSVSVAVDFARSSGGWAGPLVFNVWLRRQLRERRISQRHLAMLSGVNHSAISRLVNGHASPTLDTATKLVHALRMEWTDDQIATYFDLLPERTLLPTQRVESALRGDGTLSDTEVRAIMRHYLALRARRRRANNEPGEEVAMRDELPPAAGET